MDNSQYSVETFDKFYRNFDKYNTHLFKMIKNTREKSNNDNILDIACGTGVSTRSLAKVFKNSNILGIDSNSNMVNYANHAFVPMHVKYKHHNAKDIITLGKKFDLIIAKSALHLINKEYTFEKYMSRLNTNGTFYAIEKTNLSIDSFDLFNDAKEIWKTQCDEKRRLKSIAYYLNNDEYKIETFKFGQKVNIEASQYKNGIYNKEISCLWDFSEKFILEWTESNINSKEFISIFEEYDIIAITKL